MSTPPAPPPLPGRGDSAPPPGPAGAGAPPPLPNQPGGPGYGQPTPPPGYGGQPGYGAQPGYGQPPQGPPPAQPGPAQFRPPSDQHPGQQRPYAEPPPSPYGAEPYGARPGGYGSEGRLPEPSRMPEEARLPDPGAMPDPGMLHSTEQTRTYPCPSCGGMLAFDPAGDRLVCTSCGSAVPMTASRELGRVGKHDLGRSMQALRMRLAATENEPTADKEVVCQSCGGHTTFTGTLTALRCPYCNTPIQRDDVKDSPARLPLDGILPLRIGEPQGRELIEKWINSRMLAPNEFKKYRTLGSFSSIYLPYFNYDADTTTRYHGQRGEHYYVTVGSGDNRRQERRTRWYAASGTVYDTFRDVTGVASTNGLDDKKVQALEPWPTEQLVAFSPEFVAGHLSRTYDRDAAEVHQAIVEPIMRNRIEGTVRRDIGGDEQRVSQMDVTYNLLTFAHVMLPVWLLTVTYKEKPYQVFINGVTGELQGYRPWSKVKIALLVILGLIILGVIVAIYLNTQQG